MHAADALLVKKAYRELLQPYSDREHTALQYIEHVRPGGGLLLQSGPLKDPKVGTVRVWAL